jgi:hypothetical protein
MSGHREQLEDLRDGRWHPSRSRQVRRRVLNRYGHPYARLVYVSVIFRHDPTLRSGVEQQHCPHNHYKRAAADTCAERAARRLNRSTP